MSINTYQNESDLEFHLRAAYYECWNRLITTSEQLALQDLEQLSNPFLVKALPVYKKAKRKVLFVGQETNGWDPFKLTLDTFKHRDEEVRRENAVDFLQWMYEDLRHHRKYDHTPFWKGMRRLYQAISPGEGDDGFLHTELVRFDYANKRPPHEIENLLQQEYNVLPMEIYALKPEVVVFFTGPDYDDRLRETFHRVGGLGKPLSFEPVKDFKVNVLSRVVHSNLPYHTYRTYHPNYSLHYNEYTVFKPIEDTLSELINRTR
ncbi:hypothetical protein [Paenibacillus vini]|uniref:Uracil-DNA glycosylase n=1 Tax=Paenibacillus vini TaxID=1476024 RepID=A0ABQ4MA90_9BACL|nr:hypothetical protein [Paenibacillus vini]GIP52919.1 hypothetical protein J42TS3_19540 [Paenibacillus vini]